ncbi:hypothetical protein [Streptomyces sp. NPDC002599]|uniref:hypothetical protein n=1 Tax=Streptomyces sp. NPDC002599 TaxID=3154421 RepID=UPI00332835B0
MAFESKILSIASAEPGWTVTVSESHRPDSGEAWHSDWVDYGPFPVLSWALVETENLDGEKVIEVQPVFLGEWTPERPAVEGVTYPSKLREFQDILWETYSGLSFKVSPPNAAGGARS